VTHFSSALVYQDESGALNEAFSDIMAAYADRVVLGKDQTEVWVIGEDGDLYHGDGVGIRNMANPPEFDQPDHYDSRLIRPAGEEPSAEGNDCKSIQEKT
jgi:Zn-dependent metalloprotease